MKEILVRSLQEQHKHQEDDDEEGTGQQKKQKEPPQDEEEAAAALAVAGLLVGRLAAPDLSFTEKKPDYKNLKLDMDHLNVHNKSMEPATGHEDSVPHHRSYADPHNDRHHHTDDRSIAASSLLDLNQKKHYPGSTATESVTESIPSNHNLYQYDYQEIQKHNVLANNESHYLSLREEAHGMRNRLEALQQHDWSRFHSRRFSSSSDDPFEREGNMSNNNEDENSRPSKRVMTNHFVPETETYHQNFIHLPFHSSNPRRHEDHHTPPIESQPFKKDSRTVYQEDHPVNSRNPPFHSSYNTTLSYADYIRFRYEHEMEELALNKMVQTMLRNRSYPLTHQRMLQKHDYYYQCYDNPTDNNPFHLQSLLQASNQNAPMPTSNSSHTPNNGPQQFQMNQEYGVNRFEGIRRAGQCFDNDACTPPEYMNRVDDNFISSVDTSSVATSSAMSYPTRMPDISAPDNHTYRNNNMNFPKRSQLDRDISSQSQLNRDMSSQSHVTERPLSDGVQPLVVSDTSSVMSSSIRSHLSTRTISQCNDDMLKHLFTKGSEKSMDISSLDESSRAVGSNAVPVYRVPFPLGIPTDDLHLSDFFQFLRAECCEVFTASAYDVEQRKKTKLIRLHQVGIRCTFCANVPYDCRALRSSCYPSSLPRIYQSVTMMLRDHFSICSCFPHHVRERYHHIKANSQRKGNIESRSYWVIAAKMIGIVETEDGLFFMSDTPPPIN